MKKMDRNDADYWVIALKKKYNTIKPAVNYKKWQLHNNICIELPDCFGFLSENMKKLKYPTIHRPAFVFGSKDGSVAFTFQFLEQERTSLESLLEEAACILNKIEKKIVFYDSGKTEGNSLKTCWKEYKSFAVDGVVYNQIIFIKCNMHFIMATFHCPFKDYSQWKAFIPEILETVSELSEEEIHNERIFDKNGAI